MTISRIQPDLRAMRRLFVRERRLFVDSLLGGRRGNEAVTVLDALQSILSGGAAGALVGWLAQHLLAERLRAAIQHEYATKLESHKADLQTELARALESIRGEAAERERLNRERWDLKREACLEAP
ncbi:MAG: hypothetical protein ACRERU_07520 [Methylococcales bacterium]